jgi:hypothetical protein
MLGELQDSQSKDVTSLVELFNSLFGPSHNTVLERSSGDPMYLPADASGAPNRIQFAHGFFASALHEISHWCIAGKDRLGLVDFGYWYKPDGRTLAEQEEFLRFEAKNQALEWILSTSAGIQFYLSMDNLDGDPGDVKEFSQRVIERTQLYLREGLPPRAEQIKHALISRYETDHLFAEWSSAALESTIQPLH